MKHLKSIAYILLTICLVSCTTDSDDQQAIPPTTSISNYIYRTYNVTNDPNTIILDKNYSLVNNRIVSFTQVHQETSQTLNGTYTYTADRLSEITIDTDGVLTSKSNYTYDNTGNLITYLHESINSVNTSFYSRHSFTHTSDTIYAQLQQSTDGITFDPSIADLKLVLDANHNRTYFESFSYLNNELSIEKNTYDGNNNMIIKETFGELDGSFFSEFTNTVTYASSLNPLALINEATYGRESLMLLYHLESNALNNFSPKSISYNSIETFTSTFTGNQPISFEFLNTINEANYSTLSDYKTSVSGNLFNRFTIEYYFE